VKGTIKNKLIYYLPVPILVTTVAVAQILISTFGMLASSEGGGFGMFATIDSPEVRLIEIEAIDSDGREIDIELNYNGSPVSERLIKKIKSNPERQVLTDLADYLLNSQFVSTYDQKEYLRQRIKLESPDSSSGVTETEPERKVYKFASKNDQNVLNTSIVKLKEVRLQMWTIKYDRSTRRASTEKLGEPVVVRK